MRRIDLAESSGIEEAAIYDAVDVLLHGKLSIKVDAKVTHHRDGDGCDDFSKHEQAEILCCYLAEACLLDYKNHLSSVFKTLSCRR